jgi:hypothetical protein
MITLHHRQTPTPHPTFNGSSCTCDHGPCPSSSAITIQIHGSSSFSSDSTHNCNHSYFFPFAFHPVLSALRFFGCSSTFLPNGFLSFTLFFLLFLPFPASLFYFLTTMTTDIILHDGDTMTHSTRLCSSPFVHHYHQLFTTGLILSSSASLVLHSNSQVSAAIILYLDITL